MRKVISSCFRYEFQKNGYDKILLGCLGLVAIGCLVFALLLGAKIQNEEKIIIQLQHEINLIRSNMGNSFSSRYSATSFQMENHFTFAKEN